jgi:hypothetical protein
MSSSSSGTPDGGALDGRAGSQPANVDLGSGDGIVGIISRQGRLKDTGRVRKSWKVIVDWPLTTLVLPGFVRFWHRNKAAVTL